MCGIYGIFEPANLDISDQLAAKMRDAIRLRGPDHSGRHKEHGVLLGMNRLSIIDQDGGNQPIYNEDESLLIVYNGEVYNHTELRSDLEKRGHVFRSRSDTETVLHAFEEYGPAALLKFNGMFAFAIFDRIRKRLFLARDRLGIKPLYIIDQPGRLAFASEAKALLPVLGDRVDPDWTSISHFFTFGYCPYGLSPFESVRKLPPACYAWVDDSATKVESYWAPTYGMGPVHSFEEAKKEIVRLVEEAVNKELMSDVPLGVFLSGGLDSSAVAYFASNASIGKIHSYGLRFEETTHDESPDSRTVANHLGLIHHEFLFDKETMVRSFVNVGNLLDEPFADPTVMPLLALSEQTRKYVKVVLTGWGGDEVFAGYPTYRAHRHGQTYRSLPYVLGRMLIPAVVRRLPVSDKYMSFEFRAKRFIRGMELSPDLQHAVWMGYFDEAAKTRLFQKSILEQIKEESGDVVGRAVAGMREADVVSRIMHQDALFFLEGNGLFEVDRMTMAASLEGRVPLLNNDLLDYVNQLPIQIKMYQGKPKELLRQSMAPFLPEAILNKPKKGFGPPISAWIRGGLSDIITRLLSEERVRSQGIFRFKEIQRLLKEHRDRKADHGRDIWALVSFQLWYEKFILGNSVESLELVAKPLMGTNRAKSRTI